MTIDGARRVGFLGTGLMGEPLAHNLLASGIELAVWNRSAPALERLVAAGAIAAESVAALFAECDVVFMMLSTEDVIDATLHRGTDAFDSMIAATTLVHLGTTSPQFSVDLERDVKLAGGSYVESPVSGSREPAKRRELVGMLAGDEDAVADVRPIVDLLCASTTVCGAVPAALTMKLAVNVFLVTLVTGLAEAFSFAQAHGLAQPQGLEGGLAHGFSDNRYSAPRITAARRHVPAPPVTPGGVNQTKEGLSPRAVSLRLSR